MRDLGAKAIAKHRKRPLVPLVVVEGEEGTTPVLSSPYAPRDRDAWEALLYQAFGTCSRAVMHYFLTTLGGLVGRDWDDKAHKWHPSVPELQTIIAMFNSMKPADEAQAAYCAQLCAVHLSAMQMAKHTTRHYADSRSLAVLNKAARAYGDGLLNLKELQGKRRRKTTQVFRIEKHEHKHVHLPASGGTGVIEGSATVPGESAFGEVVPLSSREGVPRLPDARRSGRRSQG